MRAISWESVITVCWLSAPVCEKTTVDTLKAMLDEDSELVTVYYGSDVSAADAQALTAKLQESCPDVEIELQEGGQPIYYYLISVE